MKVSHSFYFNSKGSLGIMDGKLNIKANIPFVSSILVSAKNIIKMHEEGLVKIDIERFKNVVEINKYNKKMMAVNKCLKDLMKKHFSYEYLNQGAISLDFFEGSREEMLAELNEIKKKSEDVEEPYSGAYSYDGNGVSSTFVFKGTMLILTASQTQEMFKAINEHFKEYFDDSEKEVMDDKRVYKKYEKILSDEGYAKVESLLTEMANAEDESALIKYGKELYNYVEEVDSTEIYV